MFCSSSGIITYSSALTRRRVFSISCASICVVFSTCASSSMSLNTSASFSSASSSSPDVCAKPYGKISDGSLLRVWKS